MKNIWEGCMLNICNCVGKIHSLSLSFQFDRLLQNWFPFLSFCFLSLFFLFSEWPCSWMGNGHETWLLCTGEIPTLATEYLFKHGDQHPYSYLILALYRGTEQRRWELLIVNILFTRASNLWVGNLQRRFSFVTWMLLCIFSFFISIYAAIK